MRLSNQKPSSYRAERGNIAALMLDFHGHNWGILPT